MFPAIGILIVLSGRLQRSYIDDGDAFLWRCFRLAREGSIKPTESWVADGGASVRLRKHEEAGRLTTLGLFMAG
ncbi:MAG: hypothetical protein ACYDHD_11920 [Vulcanimicrobiaceae bacterium]